MSSGGIAIGKDGAETSLCRIMKRRTKNSNRKLIIAILLVAALLVAATAGLLSPAKGGGEDGLPGVYEVESMAGYSDLTDQAMRQMKDMDMTITLDLGPEGRGTITVFGEEHDLTYDPETETMDIDGRKASYQYEDGRLTLRQGDSEMIFTK